MKELILITILSIVPALIYLFILFINLPQGSVSFKKSLFYMFFGTLSVSLLLLFFELIPSWNNLADKLSSPIFKPILNLHIKYYIEVGLLEETVKFITFLLIMHYRFKYMTVSKDTLIGSWLYCGMVGLGFAIVENIFYTISYGNSFSLLFWRSITAMLAHLFFGLYMGYFFVISKIVNRDKNVITKFFKKYPLIKKINTIVMTLLIPTLIHGLYDLYVTINQDNPYGGIYMLFTILFIGLLLCYKNFKNKLRNS